MNAQLFTQNSKNLAQSFKKTFPLNLKIQNWQKY